MLMRASIFAQNDTLSNIGDSNTLKEVVVSGIIPARTNETSWNIDALSQQKMRESGAFNISDALAKMHGISQLNTGVGISKPVIRGVCGNRILAVLSGLRFDNQQWQDEHGMGLNDMGIDRVEVIKGPSGLLYGSEAIGGALNIIEEAPAKPNTTVGDVNLQLFSNTIDDGEREIFEEDVQITTRNQAGTEKYTFTITNCVGLIVSKSITLTVQ